MKLASLGLDRRIKEKEEPRLFRVAGGGVAPGFKVSGCHLMEQESHSFEVQLKTLKSSLLYCKAIFPF
jgi:hypothetical protein